MKHAESIDGSTWKSRQLLDPNDSQNSPLDVLRAHVGLSSNRTWRSPLVITPPNDQQSHNLMSPLPSRVLLEVEVTVWPKVSCGDASDQDQASSLQAPDKEKARQELLPSADPSVLASQGEPAERAVIWVVPAAGPDDNFAVGPQWLAVLRHAKQGATLFFPHWQNCAKLGEAESTYLPRWVFANVNRSDMLKISARSAFAMRVLQACPVRIDVREDAVVSSHVPSMGWGDHSGTKFKMHRTDYTGRVVGQCSTGNREFTLGPITSGSPVPAVRSNLAG